MAEPQTRPQDGASVSIFPEWGTDGTNETAPTTTEKADGYAVGAKNISSSKINWLRNLKRKWVQWFRQKCLHAYDWLNTDYDYIVVNGKPPSGSGLSTASTYSEIWIDGSRVELIGKIITVNALKDTYFAVDDSGATEQNEVANGAAAPTPSAGFVNVWKLVSDASDITATTTVLDHEPTVAPHTVKGVTTLLSHRVHGGGRSFRSHDANEDQNKSTSEEWTVRYWTTDATPTSTMDFGAVPSDEVWIIETKSIGIEAADRDDVHVRHRSTTITPSALTVSDHHTDVDTGGAAGAYIARDTNIYLKLQGVAAEDWEWFVWIRKMVVTTSHT